MTFSIFLKIKANKFKKWENRSKVDFTTNTDIISESLSQRSIGMLETEFRVFLNTIAVFVDICLCERMYIQNIFIVSNVLTHIKRPNITE